MIPRKAPKAWSGRTATRRLSPGCLDPIRALSAGAFLALLGGTAAAQGISHGELAGAIRSSGNPCNHVIEVEEQAESRWRVTCNSGVFVVSRGEDGKFAVAGG